MLKQVLTLALAGLLGASLLTGCGNSGGSKKVGGKKKVYVVLKASSAEFWGVVQKGAEQAGKELNVDVVVQSPLSETEIEKQVSIVENTISSGPDAIVVAPIVVDSLVRAIKKAKKRGIPVIVIDSKANTDEYDAYLASDNYQIGVTAAREMAGGLKEQFGAAEGEVAGITFREGAASLTQRKNGFTETMAKEFPKVKIVAFKDAQAKTEECINITQNLLSAYPELRGIYASNQNTGDGMVAALKGSKARKLVTIVVDSGPNEKEGLKTGLVYRMIVQKPWSMGHMGVEYAIRAIKGEKLKFTDAPNKTMDTGTIAITPEMMKDGSAEEFLNPIEFYAKKKAGKK